MYYVMSDTCRDTIAVIHDNNSCGHIRFQFDKDGKPLRGKIELTHLGGFH